jgi:hypothetical protein
MGAPRGPEALHRISGALVMTVAEAAALIDEADVSGMRLVLDTWHVWNVPDHPRDIHARTDRVV